jgi:hypothetical protein
VAGTEAQGVSNGSVRTSSPIISLTVPPGSYFVSVSLDVINNSDSNLAQRDQVLCVLDQALKFHQVSIPDQGLLDFADSVTTTDGTLQVTCAPLFQQFFIITANMTAIKLGSLSAQ